MSSPPRDDHFVEVYNNRAAAYHELISAEDADGNLLPALRTCAPLDGARVLDLGSGSGRIPLLLGGIDCELLALDLHWGMLHEQKQQQQLVNGSWALLQADLRALPLQNGWADVVIAGWAIGHVTGWYPDSWQAQAARALAEMRRAARIGGTLLILETLGTGALQPAPPNPALAAYYAWLENEQGFLRQEIATDYDFGTVARAAELCGFFFGEEMAANVQANQWSRVPEWTGLWSRQAW